MRSRIQRTPRILDVQVPWIIIKPDEIRYMTCALCGSLDFDVLSSVVVNLEEFFIVRCRRDKVIWLNPVAGHTFLDTLYSPQYYDVAAVSPDLIYQVGIQDSTPADKDRRGKIAFQQVREWKDNGIEPNDTLGNPKKLLEIGGGRGYFQAEAVKQGWKAIGIEISYYGIRECIEKGLQTLPIPLEDFGTKFIPYPEYFDLVAMYDFIEHVTDPGKVLRFVRRMLKSEGFLCLRTPGVDEKCGPTLHLIDHLWHFSKRTMGMLLRKEGFKLVKIFNSGIFKGPQKGKKISNITIFARKAKG